MELSYFDFELRHCLEEKMKHVDFLFRQVKSTIKEIESALLRVCQDCKLLVSETHLIVSLKESDYFSVHHFLKNKSASPILEEIYNLFEQKKLEISKKDIIDEYLNKLEEETQEQISS